MELNIDEIKKYLPHRDPFLFVDKVTDLNICKDIYGEITFNENLFFFKGHFPNRPVVPGVIIVESLAQLGGLLIYKSFEDELIGKDPALIAIDSAKFKSPTLPGDKLNIKAELLKSKLNIFKIKGQAFNNGKLIVEASITATVLK